jgi:hypothetical protein
MCERRRPLFLWYVFPHLRETITEAGKMKNYKSDEMKKAYSAGGFRERYAMEHGNKTTLYINGEKCYKFTYSPYASYQDANGATYNTARGAWIN